MSESLFPTFRKISLTPLLYILRFRLTSRLDWKSQLAAANLAAPANELILRVVKRTRLFRLEKAAVAAELASHFLDGLAAGTSAEQLVKRFGDERVAAKLIRRAKHRGRPLPWHIWVFALRATAALIGIYALLFIRFYMGRPAVTVDYIDKVNSPIFEAAVADRAWPLWRDAILKSADGKKQGTLEFSDAIEDKATDQEFSTWLDQHSAAIDLARQAGRKSTLGFFLGPNGSTNDPQLFSSYRRPREPFKSVWLAHLDYLPTIVQILSSDAKRSAEINDGAAVEADLIAILGMANQLQHADGILLTQLVGLQARGKAVKRFQQILSQHPGLLTDDQLIAFAQRISPPEVAADLMQPTSERFFFMDTIQRTFTDNGQGDGRLTASAFGDVPAFLSDNRDYSPFLQAYALLSTLPGVIPSRMQLLNKYNQIEDQEFDDLRIPLRQLGDDSVSLQSRAWEKSPIDRIRYGILSIHVFRFRAAQAGCERYLGNRDGLAVGIALELFHRHNKKYPDSLGVLMPQFLQRIPVDRINGELIKYRLVDHKPVVYSVGMDRTDDGGKRAEKGWRGDRPDVAQWRKEAAMVRGDWVLYPPDDENTR